MMKMNELYLFFFKNWLKSDWNIFIIKKSWCLLICNLQPLNHPKTQIPSSINPTFYFSLLWNALLHMCTQCKQMEMCNSAVLSLNDPAISKYDDDLHYFVLDCKKTTKYYAQNTAQICTICNVLALNKKQQRMMCENKENKSFLFTKIIPNSIQSNVSKMLPKSLIECCLRHVSRLQYGSGLYFCPGIPDFFFRNSSICSRNSLFFQEFHNCIYSNLSLSQ